MNIKSYLITATALLASTIALVAAPIKVHFFGVTTDFDLSVFSPPTQLDGVNIRPGKTRFCGWLVFDPASADPSSSQWRMKIGRIRIGDANGPWDLQDDQVFFFDTDMDLEANQDPINLSGNSFATLGISPGATSSLHVENFWNQPGDFLLNWEGVVKYVWVMPVFRPWMHW